MGGFGHAVQDDALLHARSAAPRLHQDGPCQGADIPRGGISPRFENALLPVVTVIGITFAVLASGTVISETIFQLPGIGRMLVEAMNQRDYNIVQALVTFFSA